MLIEIESEWRETGIICPFCGWMTYSDGKERPQCGNNDCLKKMEDEYIYEWLITRSEYKGEMARKFSKKNKLFLEAVYDHDNS